MKALLDQYMTSFVLFVSFFMSIYFGYKGMAAEMGLMISSGAVFLFFLNMNKFQRFRAAGISAEMRETIDEAVATKKDLEELSLRVGEQKKELKEVSESLDEQLQKLNEEIKRAKLFALAGIVK